MGLFDNLLNRNPTRDWHAQPGLELVLDLDDESFCGIRLGERADRLRKLGPSGDARSARLGSYDYTDRGFHCREEGGRFVDVELSFSTEEGHPAFPGAVRRGGRAATLTERTTEVELIALLGEPAGREAREATGGLPAAATLTWRLHRTDCVADFEDRRLDWLWMGTKQ